MYWLRVPRRGGRTEWIAFRLLRDLRKYARLNAMTRLDWHRSKFPPQLSAPRTRSKKNVQE